MYCEFLLVIECMLGDHCNHWFSRGIVKKAPRFGIGLDLSCTNGMKILNGVHSNLHFCCYIGNSIFCWPSCVKPCQVDRDEGQLYHS